MQNFQPLQNVQEKHGNGEACPVLLHIVYYIMWHVTVLWWLFFDLMSHSFAAIELNILLTRRSRLYLRFKKRMHGHSFMVLNRWVDLSAADWLPQTHTKSYRNFTFFSVVVIPIVLQSTQEKTKPDIQVNETQVVREVWRHNNYYFYHSLAECTVFTRV